MAAFGKRAKEWMTAHVPCHRVARHQPATSIELSSHHSRNTRSVVFDSQARHANIEQHALPVGPGGSSAFALGVAFDRVVALHAVGADAPRNRMTIAMMSTSTLSRSRSRVISRNS